MPVHRTVERTADKWIRKSRTVSPSTKTSKTPSPVFGGSSQPAKVGPKVFPRGTSK